MTHVCMLPFDYYHANRELSGQTEMKDFNTHWLGKMTGKYKS